MPRTKLLKDKSQIVDAAFRIIQSEGLSAVSMRRLSKEMGVSSMTLYNYVQNTTDILREILIHSFKGIYENMYRIIGQLSQEGWSGFPAYALAYALAMYDFAVDNKDICSYMLSEGKRSFFDDAELRPFYHPFHVFILKMGKGDKADEFRRICFLYLGALNNSLLEYCAGLSTLQRSDLQAEMELFIRRMFP